MSAQYTPAVRRAIARYGARACLEAYVLNTKHGEGANSLAIAYALPGVNTTRQADSAISAGKEIAKTTTSATSSCLRTVDNIMCRYGCSSESAQRYIDLREEGHYQHQALLMAGLTDPSEAA